MTNPIAAYNFDEASGTVLDRSGNGHTFTFAGTTSRTAGGGGHTDKGMTQSSAEDSTTMSAFGQTSDRTLMCWVKSAADIADGRIFEFVGGGESVWELLFRPGVMHVQAWNAATFARATFSRPTDSLWHHWTGVYDSTANELRAYLDGVLQATTSFTGPLRTTGVSIHVMNNCGPNVVVDDVRMFDAALNVTEINSWASTPVSDVNTIIGTAVGSLGSVAGTVVGKRTVKGVLASTLPTLSVATAVGKRTVNGFLNGGPFAKVTGTIVGAPVKLATALGALGGVSGTVIGHRSTSGTASSALPGVAGTASGGSREDITGTASAVLGAVVGRVVVYSAGDGEWLTQVDLDEARALQESIMYDRIRIRHDDPANGVFDVDKGYAPATGPAPFYDGKARVQARPVLSRDASSAGQQLTVLGYVVAIPWNITGLRPTDIIEVYSSRDPSHPGKVIRVQDVQSSTFETARRMTCIAQQAREPVS